MCSFGFDVYLIVNTVSQLILMLRPFFDLNAYLTANRVFLNI